MNKSWLTLIIVGLIVLFVAFGWEIYQTTSGNRSNITISVVDFQRKTLFSGALEKHIISDPVFLNKNAAQDDSQQVLFNQSGTDIQN